MDTHRRRCGALTAGTTNEYSPSVSKDGKLVFSSIENSDLYSLPLDSNHGKFAERRNA